MTSFTCRKIVEIIGEKLGVALQPENADTFKIGDAETPVARVAVTMLPTLEVLRQAVAQGCNFVITHEPLFYGHLDETADLEHENDAVWKFKRDFIERHKLVLWRFHDLMHSVQPDMITSGMAEKLGWCAFQNPEDEQLFVLPTTTLGDLAQQLCDKLGIATLRVVGDANWIVAKIALSPGCPAFESHRHSLQNPEVEVLILGEAREWETVPYAADAAASGMRKALIILGHVASEQGGMESTTRWLQKLLPDVKFDYIPTPEDFWTPKAEVSARH